MITQPNTAKLIDPERLARLHALDLLHPTHRPSFDRLVRMASHSLAVPVAVISMVDAQCQYFISHVGIGDPNSKQHKIPLSASFCQYVVMSDQPLIVPDVRLHPLLKDNQVVRLLGAISYAGFPLTTHDGLTVGALAVIDTRPRSWTDEEREILADLAHAAITEIELRQEVTQRERATTAMQQVIEQMRVLRRIDAELAETLDLDTVVTIALDAAQRISGAEDAAIYLIKGDSMIVLGAAGRYEVGTRIPRAPGILGRALRTRTPQLVPDVAADPDYVPYLPTTSTQMAVPLPCRDRLIGVLNLESTHARRFTQDALDFLSLIAGRIALSIDNAQVHELLNEQYTHLHTLYARVKELEQTKTDMIRIAAHDLRNPLGMVIGYGELLDEMGDTLTTGQHEFVQSILRGGQKMKKIITDILSLERLEATPGLVNRASVDLAALVRDVLAEYRPSADEKKLTVQLDLPDKLSIAIDEGQIREALDNLISNAIKYTPIDGTVMLTLTPPIIAEVLPATPATLPATVTLPPGVTLPQHMTVLPELFVQFAITDTGPGIAEDQHEQLFQPFFRVRSELTRQVEGTGLGLHLVKNIVQRHGGRVIFRSTPGAGSTFGFTLPALPDNG